MKGLKVGDKVRHVSGQWLGEVTANLGTLWGNDKLEVKSTTPGMEDCSGWYLDCVLYLIDDPSA